MPKVSTIRSSEALSPSKPKIIKGVDTLRFLAALWVAFYHGARFPLNDLIGSSWGTFGVLIVGLHRMIFNGTAAVVVFFVISGFCIHYPNVRSPVLKWKKFLLKRSIRIGVPFIVIVSIVHFLGTEYVFQENSILWSIYCEMAYYIIYPILFYLSKKHGMKNILFGSCLATFSLLLFTRHYIYPFQYGISLCWLYCLPLWLAGCCLAEVVASGRVRSIPYPVGYWRFGAVAFCVVTTVLAIHLPIHVGYVWTMPLFAVYCAFWLYKEFEYYETAKPNFTLEMLGSAGYSIYLVHKIAITTLMVDEAVLGPVGYWLVDLLAIALLSAIFYFTVEQPAHRLAMRLGNRRVSGSIST